MRHWRRGAAPADADGGANIPNWLLNRAAGPDRRPRQSAGGKHRVSSAGIQKTNRIIIESRYDAIRQAVEVANVGDTILTLAVDSQAI